MVMKMSKLVEIEIDGRPKKIEISSPKGTHQRKYFEAIKRVSEDPGKALDLLDVQDSIILELQSEFSSPEELNSLELRQKDRIFDAIREDFVIFKKDQDFTEPSK